MLLSPWASTKIKSSVDVSPDSSPMCKNGLLERNWERPKAGSHKKTKEKKTLNIFPPFVSYSISLPLSLPLSLPPSLSLSLIFLSIHPSIHPSIHQSLSILSLPLSPSLSICSQIKCISIYSTCKFQFPKKILKDLNLFWINDIFLSRTRLEGLHPQKGSRSSCAQDVESNPIQPLYWKDSKGRS